MGGGGTWRESRIRISRRGYWREELDQVRRELGGPSVMNTIRAEDGDHPGTS